MKKLVLISTLVASLAGMSAFGQGFFQFVTGKSQAWDGYSTGVAHLGASVNVAFLWAANGDATRIGALLGASTSPSNSLATSTYQTSDAWAAIMTDPNFTLAVNNSSSAVAVVTTTANGFVNYNSGTAFGVAGTAPDVNYELFFIGWNSAYATPQLAAAAATTGGYVGWSAPFSYQSYLQTEVPGNMSLKTGQFGVAGLIPEPTTMALAGLGGLSLLLLRRKK